MKALIASTLIALAPALALAQTGTDAATAKGTAHKSAAKSATKGVAKSASGTTGHAAKPAPAKAAHASKAAGHKSTAVAKAHTSSKKAKASAAAASAAAAAAALAAKNNAPLTPQEQEVAQQVYTGSIPCELGASVKVQADTLSPGRFYLEGKGFKYHMRPVVTSTGAVRLEDEEAGAVWLQIANKSMLMNQKLGQRMADECMSPQQLTVAQALKTNPPKSLLDGLNK